jgi:hypothetical protein
VVAAAFEEEEADAVGVEAAEHVGAGRGGERSELENAGDGLGTKKEPESGEKNYGGCEEEKRTAQRKFDVQQRLRCRVGCRVVRGNWSGDGCGGCGLDFDALNRL